MEIYIFILVILIVGAIFDLFKSKVKYIIFRLNFFLVFLLASLRYGLGVDYFQYEDLFANALPIWDLSLDYFIFNSHGLEFGYLFLESIVKSFDGNYSTFIIFYNVILFSFLYLGISNFNNRNIQLFIFYCFICPIYVMDFYRQGMAMVIFFYNIKYLLNNNLYKYLFFSLLSVLFHKSTLLLVPLYLLLKFSVFRKTVFVYFLVMISFIIAYADIIGMLINYLYSNYTNNKLIGRLYLYYFVKHDSSLFVGFLAYLHRFLLLLVILFYFNKGMDKRISFLSLLYPLVFFTLSNVGIVAGRFSALFMIFYINYFSILFSKNILFKSLTFTFMILYGVTIFYKDIHSTHKHTGKYTHIPYNTIIIDTHR